MIGGQAVGVAGRAGEMEPRGGVVGIDHIGVGGEERRLVLGGGG